MTIAMGFERFLRPLWVICIAGCASTPGTSGETHFQCSATPDCLKHGSELVCVEGECVQAVDRASSGGGAGTGGASSGGGGGSGDGGAASGGSTPTSGPLRAAAYITVFPGSGTCNATHGLSVTPTDQRVYDDLRCDQGSACSPDQYVVFNGEGDTVIDCNVSDNGDTFGVDGTLRSGGDEITVTGTISRDGGEVRMTHYFSALGMGLLGDCTLTITPTRGAVAAGSVWALFACPNFTDPRAAGGMDCLAEGAFLFEGCARGFRSF